MKGDKIIVSKSTMLGQTDEVFQVYKPRYNTDNTLMTEHDGAVVLEKSGGVKAGSTGFIADVPIMVHRSQLVHTQNEPTSIGGRDLVSVYPIYFDEYKLVGWLSTDHFRVIGGTSPGAPLKR